MQQNCEIEIDVWFPVSVERELDQNRLYIGNQKRSIYQTTTTTKEVSRIITNPRGFSAFNPTTSAREHKSYNVYIRGV